MQCGVGDVVFACCLRVRTLVGVLGEEVRGPESGPGVAAGDGDRAARLRLGLHPCYPLWPELA